MERLTAKNKHGKPIIKDWPNYMEFDIVNRLAAIEDILGDEYDLGELREMVQAKQEGRCVVLPAKTVFELVWCAGDGCDMACPVSIDGKGCCDFCDHGALIVEEVPCRQEHIERIGADVFLTSAEVEAALRREQDENR